MRIYDGLILHSASDLNAFLGCTHAAAMNLRKLLNPESLPDRAESDETMVLVQDAGHAHEADYLASLKAAGSVIEIPSTGSLRDRAAWTVDAMRAGAQVIYQATLFEAPWHGFADFIHRVESSSELGAWSYEVADTKLARSPKPSHVLQLALYSDLIARVQGRHPRAMHLVLGDQREALFRTVEFHHTVQAAKSRYLEFIETGANGSRAEPCRTCPLCDWREHCASEWEATDHLSRVAGMQKSQIRKLRAAGTETVAALAALPPETHIPKLASATFEKLRAQAVLQVDRRHGLPKVEPLPMEPNRGFARLPEPSPHDLFFDLEGDPLYPDGLEYLWGVHYRDERATARFRYDWGHDREAERAAFEATVDWFTDHITQYPEAHIYHYAPYEVSVLRRLSTAFASREDAVDNLLRHEKFVDLYAITRAAIRTSEPDISLKTLEVFFAEARSDAVTKADQSIVHYHRWRELGEQSLLDGILAYNKVDCENTERLRDWLLTMRPDVPWWTKPVSVPDTEANQDKTQRQAEREALRQAVRRDAVQLSERGRELLAHLIDFHVRANKPAQWAVFDRCNHDESELIDDGECIGGITPVAGAWQQDVKSSKVATYRFPDQETKLREGSAVLHAPSMERMGSIVTIDREKGIVAVKRGNRRAGPFPESGALIPTWPISTDILERAVERVARHLATGHNACTAGTEGGNGPVDRDRYQAIVDLIERRPPRIEGWHGGPLVGETETLIDASTHRALALDRSTLFIQGPPGSGKTHTSAHVILALIQAGKRVGVSSNSHKAINNLLAKVESVAAETGMTFSGAKKVTAGNTETFLYGDIIEDVANGEDIEKGRHDLVGGTAWLFARDGLDQQFDYLFVDEAGQVSLGHLVAMGAAAKNIILVGDQMQLAQPIQGAHPGESGLSVLDYLLEGQATIAPDRGILLDVSWRMHPAIQQFISDAVYDGRLTAHPDCARQTLLLATESHSALKPHGIRMLAMEHEGCSQLSDEEVEIAADLVDGLLGQRFVDMDGIESTIGLENILVVAPYNLQVNHLKAGLPSGARVGTVDKFQGQEAEVVIVSMATSSPADLPRHVDFFYSKNRLNVAISRARTLAVVMCNPKLLELDATTVEHLRLVNTLAWLHAETKER